MLDKAFLERLVCPLTHAPLLEDGDRLVSTDAETRRAYPIADGFPSLLIDSGSELSPQEHAEILERHGAKPFTGKRKKVRK